MSLFYQSLRRLSSSTMPQLLLIKRDASPPSCAVMWLAAKLRLRMQYREPALLQLEHKTPEFRKINPMGVIPVLQDGDFTVSESHAILIYLLEKYGAGQAETLYPSDVETRAIVNQCLYFDAGYFFIRLKNVAHSTMLGSLKAPTDQHKADLEEAYGVLEAYLQHRKYLATDHLTIADICCGSTLAATQGMLALDVDKFPKTKQWMDLLEQDEDYRNLVTAGGEKLTKILRHFWSQGK